MARASQVVEIKEVRRVSAMLRDVDFRPNDVIHVRAESAALAQDSNLAEGIPH
jgi:hypothetical protein